MERWETHRVRLRRRWWLYVTIAVAGTGLFIWSIQTRDPLMFAILLMIPLIALRQAWRIDRQIRQCTPTIAIKEIS